MTQIPGTATLPLGVYRHYKGQHYEVLGLARHSETEEWLVFYRCLYGNFDYWVRPLDMFTSEVEHDGKCQPRFAFSALPLAHFNPR